MVFKDISITRLDDFGSDDRMKLSSVLKLFENAADHHKDAVTDDELKAEMGSSEWILTQWDVKIERLPRRGEKLMVDTWIVGEGAKVRHDREFVLRTEAGDVLALGETKLSVFDVEAQRILRISETVTAKYRPEEYRLWDKKLPKLKEPTVFEIEGTVALRRSDLDYNRHVHNTAYLDLAAEILPEGELVKNEPRGFRVLYKQQLKGGDTATLKAHRSEDAWCVAIYSGDALCTLCEISV